MNGPEKWHGEDTGHSAMGRPRPSREGSPLVEDRATAGLPLRKRAIVECVNDQLKNISQIEHTRHRSVANFMVNLICGLIAYARQPKKPSLGRETIACLAA